MGLIAICAGLLSVYANVCSAFTVDTSSANGQMTGLWSNASEPGWGSTITQQYDKIFAAIYTYESNGSPVWYTASDCPVTGGGCTGALYKVTGGAPLSSHWAAANLALTPVGNVTFSFSDANTGSMSYTVNGVSGSKNIAKYVFASAPGGGGGEVAAACTAANFTTARFNAITVGMSLDQVKQLIGCTNDTGMTLRTTDFVNYGWIYLGSVSATSINVFFDRNGNTVTPLEDGSYKISIGF